MKTSTIAWILMLLILLGGGWYYWSVWAAPAPSYPATTSLSGAPGPDGTGVTGTSTSTAGTVIDPTSHANPIVGDNLMLGVDENSKLGTYLIGYTGRTLYMNEKDGAASSTCYGQCATTWPPYIVSGTDRENLQYGVNATDFGTITRTDGSIQVTYDDHPLYFYSSDTNGTANGQGVSGIWYVVKP